MYEAYTSKEGEKKYILKQIVHKYIPREIMERPKMGFSIPIDQWLEHELKDLVQEYLSEESLNNLCLEPKYPLACFKIFFRRCRVTGVLLTLVIFI